MQPKLSALTGPYQQKKFAAAFMQKAGDFLLLMKFRLNLTVVFSAVIGYWLAMGGNAGLPGLLMLVLGGFLITGAANAINQVLEKDYDKIMKRTQNRPVAAGRMSATEGLLIAGLCSLGGSVVLIYFFNSLTAFIGVLSMLLYAFVYTPLKRVGPIAVAVGAIPGALPPLIGWTAATGVLTYEAYLLFSIQFIWQFPHFWAIGWLGSDEYAKAGFKLHPSPEERNQHTAFKICIYQVFLLFLTMYPVMLGIFSYSFAAVALLLGSGFVYWGVQLFKHCNQQYALRLMIASIIYLPLLQIAMAIDILFR